MAEEFQTSNDDIKSYENEFTDESESTYADTAKYKNRPSTDESQTASTDAVKYENKPDGEYNTTSKDIGRYKNNPADEFPATDTDTMKCENKLDVEFQTTYDNNTGEYGDEHDKETQATYTDSEEYESNLSGENQITTLEEDENCNTNPIEREGENYQPNDEKTPSTFITGEEGENNPICGYGDSTSDSMTFIATEAKGDYEKEDENSQSTVSEGDGMTVGYNEILTESEAKHDYEEEGGCALCEKKSLEKDSEDTHNHKLEEENAAKTAVEDVGFVFHDNKEAEEDDEAHVKKKTFYIF